MNLYHNTIGFFDGIHVNNNVTSFLASHALSMPDKKALMWVPDDIRARAGNAIDPDLPHDALTFQAFNDGMNRISAGLKRLGIGMGDRVIIFLPMSPELYQTMNAVLKLGAIAVFLDSWARRGQLGSSANTVAPKAMVTVEAAYAYCSDVPELNDIPVKIVVGPHSGSYSATYDSLMACEPDPVITPVAGDHTALITFTTGSSGVPKGADRTHQFLAAQHYAIDSVIPYQPHDIDMPAFPIFSLNNIAAGVTTVIPCTDIAAPAADDPVKLASQILSCGVTCATLSISMISGFADYSSRSQVVLENLKRVATGGAPVSNDLLQQFLTVIPNGDVIILYGSTEAEPMAHIGAREILSRNQRGDNRVEQGVNVGFFADNLDAKFIRIHKGRIELANDDWTPFEVKPGDVGELLVSGLHVCKRYYNNEEATRDTKVYESTGKVWHRTGDLARQDEHGQVWVVGRVHNAIVRNGDILFPVRTEILLKRIPGVDTSAYVGIPDPVMGEKAYVVVAPPFPLSEAEMSTCFDRIREVLDEYTIPYDAILFTDSIPMDPRHHSKVEYPVLRNRIMNGEL